MTMFPMARFLRVKRALFFVISSSLLLGACVSSSKNAKQDCEADLGCHKQLILVKAAQPEGETNLTSVSAELTASAFQEGGFQRDSAQEVLAIKESDDSTLIANLDASAEEAFISPISKHSASPIEALSRSSYTRLVEHFHKWQGVPYQYGGTTMRGVDCSAYVQKSIKYSFNVQLPRTTRLQIHKGKSVSRAELKPGDVVFFAMSPWELHNGVYLGNGFFVHASSSKGVTRSSLDKPYWKRRFKEGRRLKEFLTSSEVP